MKSLKIICFTFLLCTFQTSLAQIFTRITTGEIVNDGGHSFGHSICDFNSDGYEDVFVNNLAAGEENFFYKNNGDGTFSKMPNIAIVQGNASTSSTWGDFNNDGFLDVFVANGGTVSNQKKNYLFANNGDETFSQVLTGTLVNQTSAFTVCSWLDVDNDSDLDLYVARSSGASSIFENDGSGSFSQQTINDFGSTWGVSWSDYDKDGDLDGFGTNWGTSNYFYENTNGSLNRINFSPLTTGSSNSLSPSWGDFNNDGWMDLFVGNSAANDRLFQNNGDGTFTEITDSPVTNVSINSEGSCWADWDNDGDLDLLVSSGGNQSTGEVRMYENTDGTFSEIEDGELTSLIGRYEGLTCFDYDKDGDLDIFISNYFNSDNLLYNNNGNENHSISIELIGTVSNLQGIGSKIYVKAIIDGEEVWQMREVVTHTGHVTQGSLKAHFGLGDATTIDSIIVVWPTQEEQVLTNVEVDQFLTITESMSTFISEEITNLKNSIQLKVSPNPVVHTAEIAFNLKKNAVVKLEILNIDGKRITSIFEGQLDPGYQKYYWEIDSDSMLQSDIFFVLLRLNKASIVEKILLVK